MRVGCTYESEVEEEPGDGSAGEVAPIAFFDEVGVHFGVGELVVVVVFVRVGDFPHFVFI